MKFKASIYDIFGKLSSFSMSTCDLILLLAWEKNSSSSNLSSRKERKK